MHNITRSAANPPARGRSRLAGQVATRNRQPATGKLGGCATFTRLSILILIIAPIFSCEDVIDIQVDEAATELVVDAWLTNEPDTQTVRLTWSQTYFDDTNPPLVENAKVVIQREDGASFDFIDKSGDGSYHWIPSGSESLGEVGHSFTLDIDVGEDLYQARAEMNRVPTLDSIVQEFRENEFIIDDGIYVEFFARDFAGTGDAYWIKSFKNGDYLSKATELNIAFDAGFDSGSQVDGIIFIPPIREFVNELNDEDIPTPWDPGEISRVEIHSLSLDAFNFLEIARDQINNGSNGIFSIPLANTRSNVFKTSTGEAALGFFNVAAMSSGELVIE